ncbi:TPA: DNA primase [Enterobacter hormaechei subsp. steigerwaltii]|nr:DNA primase [Enterobacter hormaechei subsp. steigerwaltii]
MKKSHRTWLAVPPEEKDEASKAHPRLDNGQNAIVWDKEHKLWYARPGVELNNFERWLPRPHDMSMNSDDPVIEFAQKLEDAGLVLKGLPVMDGTWQRVPTKNDKKGSKSGAYRGFLDGRPAGSYRDYRSADEKPIPWVYSGGNDMDPLARLHLRAHSQQTREDSARELEQQYNRQAGYATRYVSRLPQATTAPYLTRKGVDAAPGVRINPKGELVIPFSNAQGQIRSYQRIPETGGKDARILKDSEKTGNWFAMGTPVNGKPLLFAEGYATAASLHEASGLPVLMTIDAGNMIAVAQNARAVWPDSPFIFCADNDHQLKNPRTGEPENKGIISALKAAELTNGQIIVPAFTLDELNQKLTDFNDLDVSRGREVFHQEINVQLISTGVETPFSSEPHIHAALTRAGITSPSVQETTMENEENPGVTTTSGHESSPQPSLPEARPALTTEQGLQAVQDYTRLQNLELDAATLLQRAEADPAYKAGLTALFEQQGLELKASGHNIDTATFVETAFRDLANEASFDTRYAQQTAADDAAARPSPTSVTSQDINWQDVMRDVATGLGANIPDNATVSDIFTVLDTFTVLNGQASSPSAIPETNWSEVVRDVATGLGVQIPENATPAEMAAILNGETPESTQAANSAPEVPQPVSSEPAHDHEQQAARDYARYSNGELDAAALLQKVDADPAYKAALLSVLTQNAGDMQFNGQKIDAAAFAEASLQSLVSEARVDAAYASRETAPEAPGTAPEEPQPVSSEPAHDPEQQAASDLSRFIRSEIDAATLLQNAEADPAYRAGLLALFEQTGRDLQAQGHNIDPATYAEKTLRDLTGEIRMDEPVATSSPVTSESVMPDQENSTEQPAVTGQEAGLSREHPGDTPPASLQTQSVSDATTSPQVKDDTVPVIDLSALAMNAGDDREPEMPFIDMSAFAKEKPDPTRPAAEEAHTQEQAATQSTDRKEATDEATGPAEETDGIVYGPRRPDAPRREDLEQIIKGLTWEMLKNNTQIFRLDGEDAFRDLGNRLEMCSGASQDDRKVLAALVTAAKFYGGVIELTGSPEFKENAMRLIITHDLEIRMKLPAQRTQLEEMRKQMAPSQDAVVTHMPTPDLNRQTPNGAQVTAPQATATPDQVPPVPPSAVPPGPQPQVPSGPDASSPTSATSAAAVPPVPEPGDKPSQQVQSPAAADAIKVQEMPVEPAPSALSPGQSVTAVLKNFGEAMYENKEQRGHSFFIELENRGGSHTYWGQDLRSLVERHKAGDVVTLTLNGRDSWLVPGEEKERVKNDWSLVAASTGIAVSHARPEQGQQLQSFPVDTFGKLTQQIRQAWPDHMTDLKLPPRFEDRLFYLGEDRHPVMAPQSAAGITSPGQDAPGRLTPVMASMNSQSNEIDLLLVQSAGEHLQGVVRLNGTLYPALATPTADNSQLVINAITDQGPRFAGYGQAVNFEPDGTTRAAPQLMTFHLKGREEETPLPARLYTPEKQDDALFQRLGFEQTWKQWDDARKPEGRQEKALHQEHSHSPGR